MKRNILAMSCATIVFGSLAFATEATAESEFEAPVMLKTASDEAISVEYPGYAAPCWADLNADGKMELLVGQFKGGLIKVYEHQGDMNFADGKWLEIDGQPAEVPGVW